MNTCRGSTKKGYKCKNKCVDTFCCKHKLQEKIKINMAEYKTGRWVSPKQAIAVSYSQIRKKYPSCKKVL